MCPAITLSLQRYNFPVFPRDGLTDQQLHVDFNNSRAQQGDVSMRFENRRLQFLVTILRNSSTAMTPLRAALYDVDAVVPTYT